MSDISWDTLYSNLYALKSQIDTWRVCEKFREHGAKLYGHYYYKEHLM
jgi:hypothetical protein